MYYTIKDLRSKTIYVPIKTFQFVEQLKIYISNIYHHINPYEIVVCVDGIFLQKFEKLPSDKIIHIWQKKDTNYKNIRCI